jgi:hypothetical protein
MNENSKLKFDIFLSTHPHLKTKKSIAKKIATMAARATFVGAFS